MPLGTNLAADLKAAWDVPPASQHEAAVALAQAYYDYCSAATFGASLPVILPVMRDAMAASVEAALAVGIFATSAAAVSLGVNTFWTGVPVVGGSGAGTTTGCPGAGSIPAGLLAVGATFPPTTAIAAAGFAAVLQTATLTVICNLTLPPAGPVPTPIS